MPIIENLEIEKYHGNANDYIIINDIISKIPEELKAKLALVLCRIHFSVGADGLIFVNGSDKAEIQMRIFNNDGSEAEMCGNGIRCFSKYVYENGIVKKDEISIETLKGILIAKLNVIDDIVKTVKINMGPPELECEKIPVISLRGSLTCLEEEIEILDKAFNFTAVNMGNPHAVIFVDEQLEDDDELIKYGSVIERHERFPKKTNVEFVKIISESESILRVFERGVGITKSCGTGTCASVVAGTLLGKFKKDIPVTVHNDGGDLIITFDGEVVFMEGPVEKVFKGIIEKIEV